MSNYFGFLWIIASYFIGAVPFGYLIAKYSRGIDIRTVGRKQIGATNVFHNVGAWQGILTGFLDIAKGWLVIFLAQYFGFSVWVQILAGLAAILGHNWPIYLKFFGGRGVATLIGVTLALNAAVFPYSIAVLLVIMFLWDGAPATLIFLFIYLFSNYYTGQFEQYIFAILAFPIILFKRLDGVREDFTAAKSKTGAVLSRLLFDRAGGPRQFPRWRKIK
jgi:acyl phosphate:glycerol-3-phosphate acyltransferase